MPYQDYLKTERFPTTWCPGCGIGLVLKETAKVFEELKVAKENLSIVSGIGCSGRTAGYFNLDTFHGAHGRAIPVAEGLKLGNTDLNVVVISGDGDLTGIGGNHLLHALRRNTNITVICVVNETYGMTGGQMSPATKLNTKTKTSPYGSPYSPINIQGLVTMNKNYFFARTITSIPQHVNKVIKEAFQWEGFSFVEIRSPCFANSGRLLGYDHIYEMYQDLKKNYKLSSDEVLDHMDLGVMKK